MKISAMAPVTLVLSFLLLAAGACAPRGGPGSPPLLSAAALSALAADPGAARGQEVRVRGEIASLTQRDGKSLLSLSQLDPEVPERLPTRSYGPTFLVESDRFLPPSYYVPKRRVIVSGTVAGKEGDFLLIKAREVRLGEYAPWEKYYYPVPPAWYDYDPALEHWYTPPYFDPWRGGRW